MIHVDIQGEEDAPGIRQGGVLTVTRPEIELNVTAGDIPDMVVADVSKMEIGDTLTISDITLPEGATPVIDDRDFTIATLSAPAALLSDDSEEAEGAEEAPAEGDSEE